MADEDEKNKKPLSLNERNQLLLRDVSSSRPSKPSPEFRVRKVRLEGRRRLCKLSSVADAANSDEGLFDFDSPPGDNGRGGGDARDSDNIRDILDDLTFRLDSLTVDKKTRPRAKPVSLEPEPVVEYKSAASSLSPPSSSSSPVDEKGETKQALGFKGKAVSRVLPPEDDGLLKDDDDDDDDCVVLGSGGQRGTEREENEGNSEAAFDEDYLEKFRAPSQDSRDEGDYDDFVMDDTGGNKLKGFRLSGKIFKMLYPHQRDGLKWLWALHCSKMGGILGDDMGLGKTMQVSAFMAGLYHCCLIRRVLIVAPKTLLAHWSKELSVVGLGDKIRDYSGTNVTSRNYELQYVLKQGGILLTTYDIVRNNSKSIRGGIYVDDGGDEDEILWDYIILDEGHIIKNPKTQRAKSLKEIPSAHRIIISGTPIQNNLNELWALFSFCCPEILGDKDMFKRSYEIPILRGNDKNASDREKHIGSTVAKELRKRIKPYFLRRLKSEVFIEDDTTSTAKLSKKNEIIVWLRLTSCQRQLYEAFLNSELVHTSMEGSPLAALTILKKICDHPLLLTKRAAEGVLEGMDTMLNREELSMVEQMAKNLADLTNNDTVSQGDHNMSCKISFIMSLLEKIVEEGHKVLIFSQTRKMLNLIQDSIIMEGYHFLRIDGATKVSEREKIVKNFQEGSNASIFLLTSQVGGLGLTLTQADRVIVVDPAWNPSTDNQSVDRAYRIGQKRDVIVYRLMTCGTIEEKIYKMQVFKGALFKTATEHREQTRYFSQKDIQELFTLPAQGFDVSLTQQQLNEEHGQQNNMDSYLKKHIAFLESQKIAGISHHSLLFSKTAVVPSVPENIEERSTIGNRIVRSSTSMLPNEQAVNGAEFAFKPKDQKFTPPTCAPRTEITERPEDIEMKIKRLSQTLENKALLSRLPDSGERIRRQISDLSLQLSMVQESSHAASSQKAKPEIIDVEDIAEQFHRVNV